jgi:large subunit ribosomal protein L9
MKLILKETVKSLGLVGSIVNVSDGYARNYLLPQKKAVLNTPQNLRMLEKERAKLEIQIAKEKGLAEETAARLEGVVCRITAKVSEEDRLYGSISVRDIVDALAGQGLTVEKSMVLLPEPIKTLGTFTVPIRVYKGIKPTSKSKSCRNKKHTAFFEAISIKPAKNGKNAQKNRVRPPFGRTHEDSSSEH